MALWQSNIAIVLQQRRQTMSNNPSPTSRLIRAEHVRDKQIAFALLMVSAEILAIFE